MKNFYLHLFRKSRMQDCLKRARRESKTSVTFSKDSIACWNCQGFTIDISIFYGKQST